MTGTGNLSPVPSPGLVPFRNKDKDGRRVEESEQHFKSPNSFHTHIMRSYIDFLINIDHQRRERTLIEEEDNITLRVGRYSCYQARPGLGRGLSIIPIFHQYIENITTTILSLLLSVQSIVNKK